MTSAPASQGKRLLEAAFQEFIATGTFTVEHYFAPEYEQWSDGAFLDYDAFVQHLQALSMRKKQGYSFDSLTVHETVAEGNKFVSRHSLAGKTPGGQPFTLLVLALFEISNGQFVRCWELSHTEGGREVDQSLASTRQ